MKRKQWLDGISKEDLAFRMFTREATGYNCLQCPFFKRDGFRRMKCKAEDWIQVSCEKQFSQWLEGDVAG
ncbi:MAG: hypothetical protein IJI57_04905 [Flexilinea sp.]|nr:hypothetical protein [Flexilinea sp.]